MAANAWCKLNLKWRLTGERALTQAFKTLVTFLKENGLTMRVLLPEDAEIDGALGVRRSDLTDEGFDSYRLWRTWFDAIDRGRLCLTLRG